MNFHYESFGQNELAENFETQRVWRLQDNYLVAHVTWEQFFKWNLLYKPNIYKNASQSAISDSVKFGNLENESMHSLIQFELPCDFVAAA